MNFDVVAVTPIALFEIMISIFLISQKHIVLFLSWLFFITVGICVSVPNDIFLQAPELSG